MNKIQRLIIEQTPNTPEVNLDHLTGELILSGRSIPENAGKLYEPVMNWVTEYILNARPTTNLRFDLEYFNTASSIWLAKILNVLVRIDKPDYIVILHLYFNIEEYDEINEFEDINDAFSPITNIFYGAIPNICIKLYGRDNKGELVKDRLVFIETEQKLNLIQEQE
jgi:hypothetical protein